MRGRLTLRRQRQGSRAAVAAGAAPRRTLWVRGVLGANPNGALLRREGTHAAAGAREGERPATAGCCARPRGGAAPPARGTLPSPHTPRGAYREQHRCCCCCGSGSGGGGGGRGVGVLTAVATSGGLPRVGGPSAARHPPAAACCCWWCLLLSPARAARLPASQPASQPAGRPCHPRPRAHALRWRLRRQGAAAAADEAATAAAATAVGRAAPHQARRCRARRASTPARRQWHRSAGLTSTPGVTLALRARGWPTAAGASAQRDRQARARTDEARQDGGARRGEAGHWRAPGGPGRKVGARAAAVTADGAAALGRCAAARALLAQDTNSITA